MTQHLRINNYVGEELLLETRPSYTIRDVKEDISSLMGYEVSSQSLVDYEDREMQDADELATLVQVNSDQQSITIRLRSDYYPTFLDTLLMCIEFTIAIIAHKCALPQLLRLMMNRQRNNTKLASALLITKRIIMGVVGLVIGALFIAACAQISIPLPSNISSVPLTMQTFAIMVIGSLLGPILAPLSVTAYIFMGCAGAPFFAGGNHGCDVAFNSGTSGYILGFVISAMLTGILCRKTGFDRKLLLSVVLMILGDLIILTCGVLWLAFVKPKLGLQKAIVTGILPFLVGDAIKIVLAALVIPILWMLLYWVRSKLHVKVQMINREE
jgi:biotin transport system substrate-specific component